MEVHGNLCSESGCPIEGAKFTLSYGDRPYLHNRKMPNPRGSTSYLYKIAVVCIRLKQWATYLNALDMTLVSSLIRRRFGSSCLTLLCLFSLLAEPLRSKEAAPDSYPTPAPALRNGMKWMLV